MSYNLTGAINGGNMVLGKAGLTGLSGAVSTFSTAAAGGETGLIYANKGILAILANQSGAAAPTYDASTATAVSTSPATGSAFRPLVAQMTPAGLSPNITYTGSAACFVFGVDTSGNVRVAQGQVVNYTDTSAKSTTVPFPGLPDWFTPFSYVVMTLVSATPTSWTFGSGLWNATGLTINTPVDVMALPATPAVTA